ncbi:MAG TPA: LysR substrate-binding domain-containing protein [Phenylobacterium sp.]|jgi:LysR family glycine cleavage system transcriptional activator
MADPLASIPLSAIRVFEAAARLLSFTGAARELGMTQAAVSFQVKALERRLDQPLFRRLAREVALTPAGERLARASAEAMTALRGAVSDISDQGEGVLAITTMQTFAERWLAPRIGGFQVTHPKIAVRVDTSNQIVDLLRGEADVAVRAGDGVWPEMEAIPLFRSSLVALGPPQAVSRLGAAPRPVDLLTAPRVGTAAEWALWFAAAGVPAPPAGPAQERLAADNQVLEVAAALANGAFALASPILFAGEIASGRLMQPFEAAVPHGGGYWLVYPQDRRRARKIAAFREWMLAQIAADPAVQLYGLAAD